MDKLINDFSPGLFAMQILILILLIFLLKRFAWKPILAHLDKREEGIKSSIEAAKKAEEQLAKSSEENEKLQKKAREDRDKLLKEADSTAKKMIEKAKSEAKLASDKIMADTQDAIKAEKNAAIEELKNQVAEMSIKIAEKVVKNELDSDEKQKELASKMVKEINLN